MSQYYINWSLLFKNKKFLVISITSIILFIISILYLYTNIFNGIKYNIAKIYTINALEKDSEYALEQVKSDFNSEYEQTLKKLEKEHNEKLDSLEKNYEKVINTYKTKIQKEYKRSYVLENNTYPIKELGKIDFKSELYDILKNNKNISLEDIEILSKINNSYNTNHEAITKLELEKDIEYIKKNNVEEAKIKPATLDYEIIERKGDNEEILILNKDKLEHILPYGITFPSLFSYKLNGIVIPGYYDLHFGVDYRTRPKTFIDFYYFNNKKGKVLIADKDEQFGYKLVVGNNTENNSERFEYLHLNDFYVNKGDNIKAGQKIAETGNTGLGTGPHLHFAYIKNGFFTPYDWGIDIDNYYILKKLNLGLNDNEIKKIIDLGKENTINILNVAIIYANLKDKNTNYIDDIVKIIKDTENANKYRLKDILENEFFNGKIEHITDLVNTILLKTDEFQQIKKDKIMGYLLENKDKLENHVSFDTNELGSLFNYIENDGINNNEVIQNDKINFGVCNAYNSNVFDLYNNKIDKNNSYLENKHIENINFLIPLILKSIKEEQIIKKLNDKLKYTNIHECDILFLELGKWYQETSLNLTTQSPYGLFQIMSSNYNNLFPNDLGKQKYSIEQYEKQIKDTLNFSLGKMSYLINIDKFAKQIKDKDYVLKFWLWSYHGIVGNDPNKDAYVSNNLLYKNLPFADISATRKTAVRDGAYTFAVKLYLNK